MQHAEFVHLHVHSEYSLLDGAAQLEKLVKKARELRFPAIALTVDPSIVTAVSNDFGFDELFARQVRAHARPGDVAVGISTSGSSENVLRGLTAARACGAFAAGLTGEAGGRMSDATDLVLRAPSSDTPRVQEAHITILHIVCDLVDAEMADS